MATIITYKQLLAMAHKKGITSLVTEPLEIGKEFCFFRAILSLSDGSIWYGHGDATPTNVKPAMVGCLPRMAETRAKARALRDAMNIGEVSAEELPDFDERESAAPVSHSAPRPVRQQTRQAVQVDPNGPLNQGQATAIRNLCQQKGKDADATARERYGVPVSELSGGQAQEFIQKLQERPATVAR